MSESAGKTPSEKVDDYIKGLGDWRSETLEQVRQLMLSADSEMIEEFKWMGSPVWERGGLIAVGNGHKGKVKVTFAHGAKFPDPDKLFNGKDTGATRRSIDIFEGEALDKAAWTALIQRAITYNLTHLKKNS